MPTSEFVERENGRLPFVNIHWNTTPAPNSTYSYNETLLWANISGVPEHWLKQISRQPPEEALHILVGIFLIVVGTLGTIGNVLVLWVFTRFRRLRSPASTFIVNLAISDFLSAILHVMPAYSSFKQRWSFGQIGCNIYGGGIGLFGLVSIVTLACIAVERLIVIKASASTRLSKWKINRKAASKIIIFIWVYCLLLAAPPLFGWSRYVPEGMLTSCSWDYITRSISNRTYYIYLLTGGFIIPVSCIVYSYSWILYALVRHVETSLTDDRNRHSLMKKNEVKTAKMILALIILFIISWSPYAFVSFICQFGDLELITPWVASLPALFAKASVVYNPIVYGMRHPHFRSSLRHLFSGSSSSSQNKYKNSLRFRNRSGNIQEANNDELHFNREYHSDGFLSDNNVPEEKTERILPGKFGNFSNPNLGYRSNSDVLPATLLSLSEWTSKKESRRFIKSVIFYSESSLMHYSRQNASSVSLHKKYKKPLKLFKDLNTTKQIDL